MNLFKGGNSLKYLIFTIYYIYKSLLSIEKSSESPRMAQKHVPRRGVSKYHTFNDVFGENNFGRLKDPAEKC